MRSSYPILATSLGSQILGAFEVMIGLDLLLGVVPILVNVALLIHLASTLTVFFLAPALMFVPHVSAVSLSGEFVLKNIVLGMAGLAVLAYHPRR